MYIKNGWSRLLMKFRVLSVHHEYSLLQLQTPSVNLDAQVTAPFESEALLIDHIMGNNAALDGSVVCDRNLQHLFPPLTLFTRNGIKHAEHS